MYDTAATDLHFQEAHNDYLQLAAEGGLLVAVPALVSIACVIGGISRRLAADRNDLLGIGRVSGRPPASRPWHCSRS